MYHLCAGNLLRSYLSCWLLSSETFSRAHFLLEFLQRGSLSLEIYYLLSCRLATLIFPIFEVSEEMSPNKSSIIILGLTFYQADTGSSRFNEDYLK